MKKFFENKTNSPLYVNGTMVPPGEGVMVEVPDEDVTVVTEQPLTLAEQVALLLKDSVAKIAASLGELSDDTLEMATALESGAAKPRASLLTALADERIKRADKALTNDPL